MITEYNAIDLGLPSGTKWANMNVGAILEEDYGLYFQFGDISGNTNENAAAFSYEDTAPGEGGSILRGTDEWALEHLSGDTLTNETDAATVIMGSEWHLPTSAQIEELVENTDQEEVTVNGINGRKFINKKDSSKYIFIPASGYYDEGKFGNEGDSGDLWGCQVVNPFKYYAYGLHFYKDTCSLAECYRYYGYCARGVTESN